MERPETISRDRLQCRHHDLCNLRVRSCGVEDLGWLALLLRLFVLMNVYSPSIILWQQGSLLACAINFFLPLGKRQLSMCTGFNELLLLLLPC